MRFFTLSALLATAIASPIHEHHLHKRAAEGAQVTKYVTEVITRTFGDAGQPLDPVSVTTSTSPSVFTTILSSSQDSGLPSPVITLDSDYLESSIESEDIPSSAYSTASTALDSFSASSTKSSTSSTSTSTSISFAKGGKGITYSPYTNSGTCKDSNTIASDIALLSEFEVIRLYDTDCSCVESVLSSKTSSQKIFLGIFYLDRIQDSVETISSAVKAAQGGWDNIYSVSVGNELVNFGKNTPSDIQNAIESTRSALKAAGYSGTVVSVDTLVAVQNNPSLCEYSDFIAVNSHPFWDGSVKPEDSGSWLKQQIDNVKSVCGGNKDVLITETGWPTQGDSYGSAVPSIANQQAAVKSIVDTVGDQVILFTVYDDLWKDGGAYGVEKYWGLVHN